MRLYPDSKVYIVCPGNYNSGGPELLHQLCSQLITFGINAFMVYIPAGEVFNRDDPVHDFYKKYHLPYTFNDEDSERNIIVLPEMANSIIYLAKKYQCILWWLSVNNYFVSLVRFFDNFKSDALAKPIPRVFYFTETDKDIEHWVQSEYARQFVTLNGVPESKIRMVSDYLNQEFLNRAAQVDLSAKKNIVAYNPKKGFKFTQQLMKLAPDIDWRPIKNMTPAQVQELLAAAKVYIDFGEHPGKDRIPREAAISGCVVITGRRGAADNDVDINIPAEFKFDERTADARNIIDKIREVFDDFDAAYEKQAAYRARILDEKNRFVREVASVFGIKNLPPPSVAFSQGVGAESSLLVQELFKSAEFKPAFIVDDLLASADISHEILIREQNRNYLRGGENLIEIITRDDAKFLYLEGRIKKFAVLEPDDAELVALKDFFAAKSEDVLIFNR